MFKINLKFFFIIIPILSSGISSAIKPDSTYKVTPENYNIPFKEIVIKTKDDFEINTWIYDPDSSSKKNVTIILAGTDAGNMSYFIYQAANLMNKGYRVVCFDYRGFGHSSKFNINRDYLYYDEFSSDLLAVLKYSREKYPSNLLGIYGLSMGSLISFSIADSNYVDFIIAEGVVFDAKTSSEKIGKTQNRKIIYPPSAERIKNIALNSTFPMLLIEGQKDNISAINDCLTLLSDKKNREIIVFNGGHLEGIPILQNCYFDYIEDFIDGLKK